MDIPENLKKFLNLKDAEKHLDLVEGLIMPKNKGTLINLTALAEEEITALLIRYFALPHRTDDFQSLLSSNLTFDKKIKELSRILPKLDATEVKYQPHLRFLRALQKLRNTASHSYSVHIDEATKLATDTEITHITADFPENLYQRIRELRDYLSSLKT